MYMYSNIYIKWIVHYKNSVEIICVNAINSYPSFINPWKDE